QVRFHAEAAGERISEELPGELRIAAKQVHHGLFFYAHNGAVQERARRGAVDCLTSQAIFPEEAALGKNGEDRLLAVIRLNGEPDLARLDVEHRIRRLSLREDWLIGRIYQRGAVVDVHKILPHR